MQTLRTYSSRETNELGYDLAQKLKKRGVCVVALHGNLGAGKTTFVQGFARGLGVKRRIASPTFIIMRRFAIRSSRFKNLYHIDAYRLKDSDLTDALGLKEIFADPRNLIVVEWPEKMKKILPKGVLRLTFRHSKKENERTIVMRGIIK